MGPFPPFPLINSVGSKEADQVVAYGTYFFQIARVGDAFMNTCILTSTGVLVIIINSCVISKIGRRRVFLMIGMSVCGVSQFAVAAVWHVAPGSVSTGKVRDIYYAVQSLDRAKWSPC